MSEEKIIWLDYNNAGDQHAPADAAQLEREKEDLRAALLSRLSVALTYLLPAGRFRHHKFCVGDVRGNAGDSLVVETEGGKAGMWHDFATGEGGDIFDLWAAVHGLDARSRFPDLMDSVRTWLGEPAPATSRPAKPALAMDDLGPYTGKWDYLDRQGRLIACVYRYDPPEGKQFRPWDVKVRAWKAPDPRPLYNQPGIALADAVVLVEGEKAAQALIDKGICATTAMNGANAPVEKTDWSPLAHKQVLVWPDHDAPGLAYAEAAARAVTQAGAASVAILRPPAFKPEKWDAADAVTEGFDIAGFMETAEQRPGQPAIPAYSFGQLLDDTSPMPEDIIGPRVLTPGGMMVFGGAPKVGKSDFLLAWLTHMAGGAEFLGMVPFGALRIFYLQAEVQYHYLRERIRQIPLPDGILAAVRRNLVLTAQLRMLLNDTGVQCVADTIARVFPEAKPDIIVIDPIRNVFDGGSEGGNENDNAAMLFFLRERVERLREMVNPGAGIILAHHTRKIGKKQFEEDPFQALSGAGSLRGYYSTGAILYRPDESRTERLLIVELRNGPAIPNMVVDKIQGQWRQLDSQGQRLVQQSYGERLDAERNRKHDVILQLIAEEAREGSIYTTNQFAEKFENKAGLGGKDTIADRISVLATKGYIKFFKDGKPLGFSVTTSKYGFLCVEDLIFGKGDKARRVLPSHFKCPNTAAVLPVENPEIWVVHETEDQS